MKKTLALGILIATIHFNTAAATPTAVEFKQTLPTTMEELATVDILTEICPKILGADLNAKFNQGYERLVAELLPKIENPVLALQSLHGDNDYDPLLKQAREDAAQVTVEENRQVCLDVVNYPTK